MYIWGYTHRLMMLVSNSQTAFFCVWVGKKGSPATQDQVLYVYANFVYCFLGAWECPPQEIFEKYLGIVKIDLVVSVFTITLLGNTTLKRLLFFVSTR